MLSYDTIVLLTPFVTLALVSFLYFFSIEYKKQYKSVTYFLYAEIFIFVGQLLLFTKHFDLKFLPLVLGNTLVIYGLTFFALSLEEHTKIGSIKKLRYAILITFPVLMIVFTYIFAGAHIRVITYSVYGIIILLTILFMIRDRVRISNELNTYYPFVFSVILYIVISFVRIIAVGIYKEDFLTDKTLTFNSIIAILTIINNIIMVLGFVLMIAKSYINKLDLLSENRARRYRKAVSEGERDKLTGLYNRKKIEQLFEELEYTYVDTSSGVCLFFIDVDNFKVTNDVHGHNAGDKVLIKIAKVLESCVRKHDCVSRWGGDEFVIIFKEVNLINAWKIRSKLKKDIGYIADIETPFTTVSIGVAEYHEGMSLANLLEAADKDLYEDKKNKPKTTK